MHRVQIGDVSIYPLPDIPRLEVSSDEFFPGVGLDGLDDVVAEPSTFVTPRGRLIFSIGGHLIRVRDRYLIVDCGVGNHKDRVRPQFHQRTSDAWMSRLSELGVEVGKVSWVILTHLHVDHVGWATTRRANTWSPTFPNATYFTRQQELYYWSRERTRDGLSRTGDYLADSVLPLSAVGQLDLGDPNAVLPGEVWVESTPGHTPGNTIVRVASRGQEAILAGDVLHHPLQLADPTLNSRYCCAGTAAIDVRARILHQAAERDAVLIPAHFPGLGAGRVTRTTKSYRFLPLEG